MGLVKKDFADFIGIIEFKLRKVGRMWTNTNSYRESALSDIFTCNIVVLLRLQLNAAKTELIWFGSRQMLEKLTDSDLTLDTGTTMIRPLKSVRDLGVHLNSELTMKTHISKVVSCWYHQLRRILQVRRLIGQDVIQQLVSAFILSRLDYCNSLLSRLPRSTIQPLQRVMNAAARVIMNLSLCNHVKPALKQLHWLPIEQRITYKLCLFKHHIHTGQAPQYLSNCIHSFCTRWLIPAEVDWLSGLRSAKKN